jgi:SAM-dependent methyltransferase
MITRLRERVKEAFARISRGAQFAIVPRASQGGGMTAFRYEHGGICACCGTYQVFHTDADWFRDTLICPDCGSVVRERALALVLSELLPTWRELAIHESSPAPRAISARMAREAPGYVASHYFSDAPPGSTVNGYRSEDLENQTFGDETFDLVVTLDVMEHVFDPGKVYREIYRTLKRGGYYLHTFPIRKHLVEPYVQLAKRDAEGAVHLLTGTPEYHGNPISDQGSLVVFDYGYDISRQIAQWAPFDVRISRFWDQSHGIIGEYTEVIICHKPAV